MDYMFQLLQDYFWERYTCWLHSRDFLPQAVYRWNTRKATEQSCFEAMFKQSLEVFDYKAVKMEKTA